MNVLLSHFDLMPIFYGILMFAGIAIMLYKLLHGSWVSLIIDVVVFMLVFRLHGGTMAGGFAAMICAMLAGLIFPLMLRRFV
jgi:hypothetical protein